MRSALTHLIRAVEEFALRFSVIAWRRRTPSGEIGASDTADVELLLLIGSASRSRSLRGSGRFDIIGQRSEHLAFGHGRTSFGAPLARLEARIVSRNSARAIQLCSWSRQTLRFLPHPFRARSRSSPSGT